MSGYTRHTFWQDRPREDLGFFGPDSPTWKVWTSPTALIAFQRSIVVETFDPFLAAAVDQQNGVREDPLGRMDGTLAYFTIVAIGDSRSAIEASRQLMGVHAEAVGVEPHSGKRFNANNPESQLWIHITGWHSVLLCYEKYGPGKLGPEEEQRYWADCAVAAELQTCDPERVPRNREELHRYYESVRDKLHLSAEANDLIDRFLNPEFTKGILWPAGKSISVATIATIPRWMRELGGFDQPRALDLAVRLPAKALVRALTPRRARLRAAKYLAPSVGPIWNWALWGDPPLRAETTTPALAKERLAARAS
ncbi:oxygenase MpaB family protein [Sciscionella sediminilitoris]|uniref:oxygenase MpaB family protein n=1 Tax=Sciscionella sediminilitoris TaxID=1445613 RepID=UPI000690EDA3|nr:oxygenase MpaB family protein [Sciscionella sp. SE31]